MSTPDGDRDVTAHEASEETPTSDTVVKWVRSHRGMAVIVALVALAASVIGITLASSGPHSRAYQAGFTYGEYQATNTPAAIVCDPSQVLDFTFKGQDRGQFQQGCDDGYNVAKQAVDNPASPLPAGLALPYNRLRGLCLSASEVSSIIGRRVENPFFDSSPIIAGTPPTLSGNCGYDVSTPDAALAAEIAFSSDPPMTAEMCSKSALTTGQTFPQRCTAKNYATAYIDERQLANTSGLGVTDVGGIGQAAFFERDELVVERRPELVIILGPTSSSVAEALARQVLPRVERALGSTA